MIDQLKGRALHWARLHPPSVGGATTEQLSVARFPGARASTHPVWVERRLNG